MIVRSEEREAEAETSGWEAVWSGGSRAVHLGNVADFNVQFADAPTGVRRSLGWHPWHRYACLALFYTPHPAAVVLPDHLDDAWLNLLSRRLEWDRVELYSGIAEDDAGLLDALTARPTLVGRLRELGPFVPWGRTAQFDVLADRVGDGVLAAVRRFESKEAAHTLFQEMDRPHLEILVYGQERPHSRSDLTRLVARRAAEGRTVVLKSEFGVAGHGTVIVTPRQVAMAGGAHRLINQLIAGGDLPSGDDILVERYVEPSGRMADLTFDAVIAEDAVVQPVGVAVMRVEGTGYRGATVGPGVVPVEIADRLTRYGTRFGRILAEHGYRGWFDIDFVRGSSGRFFPTETNLRLTGPAVAFMIKARLDRVRGPGHLVRTLDELPLGARLPEGALFEHVDRLGRLCASLDTLLLPTLPAGGFHPRPTLGVAIAASSVTALDAAESLVRAANMELGDAFDMIRA